ncbi:DUF7684 family protein [Pseudonocardia sp. TMWB2A]|uniref:DUF7684 family protein n=1 Tax=Pseudonocardia sp. TMWB2A TaxID=687430 RepID=UPI00307D391B
MPIEYHCIKEAGDLPKLGFSEPFKAGIIADIAVDPDRQTQVAEWLYSSGCRYTCAWGVEASSWELASDFAYLEASNFEDTPDSQFCLTTCHEGEPLREMFYFLKYLSGYYDGSFNNDVVLIHISDFERTDLIQEYEMIDHG